MTDTVEARARAASESLRTAADLQPAAVPSTRSRAPLVVVATAAVVVVIAAVAVGLTGRGSRGGGGGLTLASLAATTQKQSARITMTQLLPSDPSDRHPYRFVTTAVADYRTGNGRFVSSTQSGSGMKQDVMTELVVAGHRYLSIGRGCRAFPRASSGRRSGSTRTRRARRFRWAP